MKRNYDDPVYKRWRIQVYKRDNFTCQMPGCKKKTALQAHHIQKWANASMLRYAFDRDWETHTIREFLDVAFNEIGIKDWSNYVVQDPEFYRPAEVDYLRGDCSKANEKLGWTPRHSFEDLVKMMVKHDLE